MKLRIFQPLDLAAGGLALALIIIISVVILVGTWEGIHVNIITADESGEIGPLSSILLKFSEPVNQTIAQSLFSIQPKAAWQARLDRYKDSSLHSAQTACSPTLTITSK